MPVLMFIRGVMPGVILRSVCCDEGAQHYVLLNRAIPVIALFSLALASCSAPSNPALVATINGPASPAGELPANPLQWQVITSLVDEPHSTMSTLYGNDLAIRYARSNSGHEYPDGSQLALITWTQREDPRWFGANIPDHLQSVEFVTVAQILLPARSGTPKLTPFYTYQRFDGSPLQLAFSSNSSLSDPRVSFILSLQPSLFP